MQVSNSKNLHNGYSSVLSLGETTCIRVSFVDRRFATICLLPQLVGFQDFSGGACNLTNVSVAKFHIPQCCM